MCPKYGWFIKLDPTWIITKLDHKTIMKQSSTTINHEQPPSTTINHPYFPSPLVFTTSRNITMQQIGHLGRSPRARRRNAQIGQLLTSRDTSDGCDGSSVMRWGADVMIWCLVTSWTIWLWVLIQWGRWTSKQILVMLSPSSVIEPYISKRCWPTPTTKTGSRQRFDHTTAVHPQPQRTFHGKSPQFGGPQPRAQSSRRLAAHHRAQRCSCAASSPCLTSTARRLALLLRLETSPRELCKFHRKWI